MTSAKVRLLRFQVQALIDIFMLIGGHFAFKYVCYICVALYQYFKDNVYVTVCL